MNKPVPPGFSADGFILDQDALSDYPYGRYRTDWNGCGWIAAYNLLLACRRKADPRVICREMSDALHFGGTFGTAVSIVRGCLRDHGVETDLIVGKSRCLAACARTRCGILRFHDGEYPHYVTFASDRDGLYRFYNSDPADDSHLHTMEDFFREHMKRRFARAILPREGRDRTE